MSWLRKNKQLLIVILLLLLTLPSVWGIFHPGFFLSDDGNWMIIRLSAFYESIRNGQFPPRFLLQLNHGYGYPVADFLYPLFLYVGVPIHILGISFTNTVKVILGASMLFSGIFTFFWLRKLVKASSAFVGSVIYVFAPYHLWDVYHRGSVGEVLALCIVPYILWQMEKKQMLWTAIGIALLILSHNSLALLFLPFLIGYTWIRKLFAWKHLVGIVGYALGLCAFFWMPALYDKQFTIFDTTPVSIISNYFLSYNTLFLVGWIGLLIILFSFFLLAKKVTTPTWYFWLIGMGSLFLALPFSSWLWHISHMAPYFQFPYRFLSLTILCLAALAAFFVNTLSVKLYIFGVVVFLAIAYFSSWNLLVPTQYQYYPDTFYSTNQDSTTVHNEYTPIWVKMQPTVLPDNKVEIVKGNGVVMDIVAKGGAIFFDSILNIPSTLQVNIVYFPGWKVFIDGKETKFSYDNTYGVMQFVVPAGAHTIKSVFGETPLRLFADIITILSILFLPFLYKKLKKYEIS